jgi:hypothetical protein
MEAQDVHPLLDFSPKMDHSGLLFQAFLRNVELFVDPATTDLNSSLTHIRGMALQICCTWKLLLELAFHLAKIPTITTQEITKQVYSFILNSLFTFVQQAIIMRLCNNFLNDILNTNTTTSTFLVKVMQGIMFLSKLTGFEFFIIFSRLADQVLTGNSDNSNVYINLRGILVGICTLYLYFINNLSGNGVTTNDIDLYVRF